MSKCCIIDRDNSEKGEIVDVVIGWPLTLHHPAKSFLARWQRNCEVLFTSDDRYADIRRDRPETDAQTIRSLVISCLQYCGEMPVKSLFETLGSMGGYSVLRRTLWEMIAYGDLVLHCDGYVTLSPRHYL